MTPDTSVPGNKNLDVESLIPHEILERYNFRSEGAWYLSETSLHGTPNDWSSEVELDKPSTPPNESSVAHVTTNNQRFIVEGIIPNIDSPNQFGKAWDTVTQKIVFVKLSPSRVDKKSPIELEGKTLYKISKSSLPVPNAIAVMKNVDMPFGIYDCLVMDYVEGKPLSKIIESLRANHETLPLSTILKITTGLATFLDELYEKHGILYKDLKPPNIIMDDQGAFTVIDFDASNWVIPESSVDGFIGTYGIHASPEHFDRSYPYTRQSDQFSLVTLFYHLLTDKGPFGDALKGLNDNPLWISVLEDNPIPLTKFELLNEALGRDIVAELNLIIVKALDKSPEERYRTCTELARSITQVLTNGKIDMNKSIKTK